MYFITTKRMLEVCFSAHPNIQYRTGILIPGCLFMYLRAASHNHPIYIHCTSLRSTGSGKPLPSHLPGRRYEEAPAQWM